VNVVIRALRPADLDAGETLLGRFFREDNFATEQGTIRANLAAMAADSQHWVAIAWGGTEPVGIVTLSTMLYIEWGRLGEIGDLYVLPEARGRGVARALIEAAIEQCRARGCSAASITITPDGEDRHGLAGFYAKLGFVPSGRSITYRRLR